MALKCDKPSVNLPASLDDFKAEADTESNRSMLEPKSSSMTLPMLDGAQMEGFQP